MPRFRIRLSDKDGPVRELDADDHAIDGDWLVLRSYLPVQGHVPVFRTKKDNVYSIEQIAHEAVTGWDDGRALGRVWAMLCMSKGLTLENALRRLDAMELESISARDEVARLYAGAGLEEKEGPTEAIAKDASKRLGKFPVTLREKAKSSATQG